MIPQPERTQISEHGLVYTFPAQGAPASVRLELCPLHIGFNQLDLQVPGFQGVHLTVFVFP